MADTAKKESGNKRKIRIEVTDNKAAIHGYYRFVYVSETGRVGYRNDKSGGEIVIFLTTMTVVINKKDGKTIYHRRVTGEKLDEIFATLRK